MSPRFATIDRCSGEAHNHRLVRWLWAIVGGVLIALASGCGARLDENSRQVVTPSTTPDESISMLFTEVTTPSNIAFTYRNGEEMEKCAILEIVGGGVGVLDFDLDGLMDVIVPGGGDYDDKGFPRGKPTGLFRQIEPWRFQAAAAASRIEDSVEYSHGIAVDDVNNDGFPDLLITGYGGIRLWWNLGDGTWQEGSFAAGLRDPRWSTSAAWGDFNGDGNSDVYVARYVNWSPTNSPECLTDDGRRDFCGPRVFGPLADSVFISQGDGTFADATESFGVRSDGKGLGVVVFDADMDRDVDIYVANDATANFLYRNESLGAFHEVGLVAGCGLDEQGAPDGSMGVAAADLSGDGFADLWVVNFEQETFAAYKNLRNGSFLHSSQALGLNAEAGLYVGWGTVATDLDLDGDVDLAVVNGNVFRYPKYSARLQKPLLFLQAAGRFYNRAATAGDFFKSDHDARGLAAADLDNDGDPDLIVSRLNQPVVVLRNDLTEPRHWVGVRLIGTRSSRSAVGAIVRADIASVERVLQVTGGGSYLSASDSRLVFAVPTEDSPMSLRIDWPSGIISHVRAPACGVYHAIVEPTELQ